MNCACVTSHTHVSVFFFPPPGSLQTMLSLAKLALLASDEQPQKVEEAVSVTNRDLDLVVYQEELPEVVLSSYGYDVERLRVLTPAELVKVSRKVLLAVRPFC